jgi:hypothetical protein
MPGHSVSMPHLWYVYRSQFTQIPYILSNTSLSSWACYGLKRERLKTALRINFPAFAPGPIRTRRSALSVWRHLYYRWCIVVACNFVACMNWGVGVFNQSVFLGYFVQAYGWRRSILSLDPTLFYLQVLFLQTTFGLVEAATMVMVTTAAGTLGRCGFAFLGNRWNTQHIASVISPADLQRGRVTSHGRLPSRHHGGMGPKDHMDVQQKHTVSSSSKIVCFLYRPLG